MFTGNRARGFDRRVCRDVAGVALEADLQSLPSLLYSDRQPFWIAFETKGAQKSFLSFEDSVRSSEAVLRQRCGQDAAFRRAAEVQAFHHPASAGACKFEKAAGQGSGNSNGI